MLSAQILRKISPENENLSAFLDLSAQIIEEMEAADQLLRDRSVFEADMRLSNVKQLLPEIFMLRGISDAVGAISLAAMQSANMVAAIVDAPALPAAIVRAMRRLWAAPFMSFEEAAALAKGIEQAGPEFTISGYNELINELIDNARASRKD
jgi:hypothetical protein